MNPLDETAIAHLVKLARQEDLGTGDVTTSLLPDPNKPGTFRLVGKERGVLAGTDLAAKILSAYDESIEIEWCESATDGAWIDAPPQELATIRGPLGSILSAERVLLNFIQRLTGVATLTRAYVDAIAGTGASILDTRKTTPGWRTLEKYAVRCGGGKNHRQGLFDAVLIKDNHLAGTETHRVGAAVFDLLNLLDREKQTLEFVEVEADTLGQVEEILKIVGVDIILLDNFSLDELRQAVELRNSQGLQASVALEASGGVTLSSVRAIAETGVERISVGALTHSATAVDMSLERD